MTNYKFKDDYTLYIDNRAWVRIDSNDRLIRKLLLQYSDNIFALPIIMPEAKNNKQFDKFKDTFWTRLPHLDIVENTKSVLQK